MPDTRRATRWCIVLAALTLALTGLGLSRVYAAVDLNWFKATPQDDHILLEWETATELDTSGFYILRSTDITGPFNQSSRIPAGNPFFVPAKSLDDGGFLLPHQYEYQDRTALPGVTYFYVLEEIDFSGHSHLYLQNKDAAVFGVPSPTATTTPTVSPTPVASGTPTQTPVPAVTPAMSATPTATPPPPTHTLLVLGGAMVTSPSPPPADTSTQPSGRSPAPAQASPTPQPTEASQPAPLAPTQVKPTQQPTRSQVTAAQATMPGQPETVATPTIGAELVLATPTGAEPATAVAPSPRASSATAPPRLTTIPAQTQEQPPAPPREAGGSTSPMAMSGDLSLAWKLGGALVIGGLALALSRLLRPSV